MLCCFSLPDGAKISKNLDDSEAQAFSDIMQFDHLRVVVKRRLQANNHLMLQDADIDAPELEVSLYSRSGTDLLLKLSRQKLLHKYFRGLTKQQHQQPIDQRLLLKPPPPFHLVEEARPSVELEKCPTSPLPDSIVSRAIENVIWWFEHKYCDEAASFD